MSLVRFIKFRILRKLNRLIEDFCSHLESKFVNNSKPCALR